MYASSNGHSTYKPPCHTIVDATVNHLNSPEPQCQRNQRKDSRTTPPTIADIPRFCAPVPVNKVELTGDAPDDGDTAEGVGVIITRTEVLLSLISSPVGEINALDLVRMDAMTLEVSGWVPFRDPPSPDVEPTNREQVTLLEGTALCALILLLASVVDL